MRRPRVFSACLNRQTVRWIGPSDYRADFSNLMKACCVATGDDLMLAPDQEVWEEVCALAKTRGFHWKAHGPKQEVNLKMLLGVVGPSEHKRGAQWGASEENDHRNCFMADWSQNLATKGGRSTCGPIFPVLLKNSLIVSHSKGRRVTASESLGALGMHVFDQASGPSNVFKCPYGQMMKDIGLSSRSIKALCGNGMHIPAWMAWFLYIMSNTVRIRVERIQRYRWAVRATWEDFDSVEDEARQQTHTDRNR
eukprot:3307114-Alexandrium_andersonii.AAC.1